MKLRILPAPFIGLLTALLLTLVPALAQTAGHDKKEWIQLFNGKDLKDWEVKITGYEPGDNFGDTYRVAGGVMKVAYDKYDKFDNKFGNIFFRGKFSHYIVAVEYRFTGDQVPGAPAWALRNSGIMIHSQSAGSMLRDQDFPISIEVQLLGGSGSGSRATANLCTPGTNVEIDGKLITQHCVNSAAKTYHGDQWVRVEVMVLGSSKVKHIVEAQTVLEYEKPLSRFSVKWRAGVLR
ncbi:MAG: DUF1080 domain-containing protein [Bryobacteraceae bacterium]|nr:DUF1080 domain-containing protein [Bryobacteraceae bacterium]